MYQCRLCEEEFEHVGDAEHHVAWFHSLVIDLDRDEHNASWMRNKSMREHAIKNLGLTEEECERLLGSNWKDINE